MARCDLCGGACAAHKMETLLNQYQAAGVSDLCPSCRRWADGEKSRLIAGIAPSMRAAVAARKGAMPVPWWRRALGLNGISQAAPADPAGTGSAA